jgi:hypothetical protein
MHIPIVNVELKGNQSIMKGLQLGQLPFSKMEYLPI